MPRNKPFVLGVSGNAGCGKSTLARIIKSRLPKSNIYSLAALLRVETESFLNKFGHNVWTEDREEKSKFRTYLVETAEIARQATKGQYYWKKLWTDIVSWERDTDFCIISDVRFDEFENDEIWWVKQNGILVYIEGWKGGVRIGPANHKEKQNEHNLKHKADYTLEWDHEAVPDPNDIKIYSNYKRQIDTILELCSNKIT